ncbi:DUF2971 domain-containing protein [uncultured Methanobrevibacter sp.]|uniref:DUF2971 domain-containing protein n=1 Tax=uncultured Methanobrevibacter sp. TaxID=253161 RepID=UPI0025FBA0A9|nr:DUF2971 domain-containing protein [uncultured Methanobrevibacter sp.]
MNNIFQKIRNRINCNSNDNLNLRINQMNKIIQNRDKHFPKELFRYRHLDSSEEVEKSKHVDALINEKIYLTEPYILNDPYDSAFSIDIEKFKQNILKNSEQKIKEEYVKKIFEQINIDIQLLEDIDALYEDMNIDMSGMYELIENETNQFYTEYLKNEIKFRISCFSETSKSILMWSHYANEHQGFCIGYDSLEMEEKTRKKIYPVFYHEEFFPNIKTENELENKQFNSLIKYKDWKYEKEWRLISYEKFLHLKPSKIYLGVRFNKENLDFFKDIAVEKNCDLYQMDLNYSKYALDAKKIKL